MRKSRFTEAQIIGMIKEQEAGMPTAEVWRKHGLSQGTFYKYKSKYGGMEVSDVAKMRSLEDENAKLKRLLADTMLDNVVPKDLLGKSQRRQVNHAKRTAGCSASGDAESRHLATPGLQARWCRS